MILLDTNILLEILEKRQRLQAVLNLLQDYKFEELAVTALTLSNVFYIVERHRQATGVADELLSKYKVVNVTADDADWAFEHYKGEDFEDALQVAAAIRTKCSVFLTLDRALAKKYSKFLNIKLVDF